MKIILITALVLLLVSAQVSKEKITFEATDGLTITADLYLVQEDFPYIVLLHQEGSSRGEYNETAFKLTKLNYNCLAVDLRSGDNENFVSNETARMARQTGKPTRYLDASADVQAAIDYAYNLNNKKVILFGSSYSASLCLLIGKDNPNVQAVIAFSPGEYFGEDLRLENELDLFDKPLFVTGTRTEYTYITQMLQNLNPESYTLFQPSDSVGIHGSKALWEDNESKDEYWLALLLFFNSLKNT